MKHRIVVATAFACALLSGAPLQAAPGEARERAQLQAEIVSQWGPHVAREYKLRAETWAGEMAPAFAEASIEELRAAAAAPVFDDVNRLLLGGPAGAPFSGKVIGDAARDLVFVPITPCRILDTRIAGGQIQANTTRGVDVTAATSYAFQGGVNNDCGGMGTGPSFAAVAVNLTVVAPTDAGYITAFPLGTPMPTAATVNYAAGAIVGNYSVVKLDQGPSANEMNIYSFATTHVVADVVGYYIAGTLPAVTMQCQSGAVASVSVAAGSGANAFSPACPANYVPTATNCQSTTWQMPIVYSNGGTCSAFNNSGSAATLRAGNTCCRINP